MNSHLSAFVVCEVQNLGPQLGDTRAIRSGDYWTVFLKAEHDMVVSDSKARVGLQIGFSHPSRSYFLNVTFI